MKYSTVDEYLAEVVNSGYSYPTYQGDFFPYLETKKCDPKLELPGACPTGEMVHHWTGYYSTKP